MQIFRDISFIVFVAFVAGFAWQMFSDYQAATPEEKAGWKNHLWAMGAGSATKFAMRLVGLSSSLLGGAVYLADALQLPQVADAINKYVPPEAIPAVTLAIALIGIVARNRTL